MIIGIVIVGFYGFYLDARLKHDLMATWCLLSYLRPLSLSQGQNIPEITQELELLGYRKVTKLRQSGEFTTRGSG